MILIDMIKEKYLKAPACIPKDGGFDEKWMEPNVKDPEKAINIICPSGSHVAPWQKKTWLISEANKNTSIALHDE